MKNTNKMEILNNQPRLEESLNPWQVTGLTDGEGGFYCSIFKTSSTNGTDRFRVKLEFKVVQKSHSEGVLFKILNFFSCGTVVIDNRKTDTKNYHVTSINEILNKIIPHFETYPCLTSKFLNFRDCKEIARIMETKDHLIITTFALDWSKARVTVAKEGLEKIREISSKMNTGRTFRDKYNFLSHSLNLESNGTIQYKLPEYWVQTFIDGEGMFYNYLKTELPLTSLYEKNKVILDSSLEIAQANLDVLILIAIKQFFNGGYTKPKYNVSSITECKESRCVNRFILRDTKIIEFVNKYPMLTRKHLDYLDWKTIVELKNNGEYKSPKGLAKIQEIKGRMNTNRDLSK